MARFDLSWAKIAPHLQPPTGVQVRRLIAVIALCVGLPRLPIANEILMAANVKFVTPATYGVTFVVAGIALAVTAYTGRLRIAGRLAAGLGFVAFVTLGLDAWHVSFTSAMVNFAIAGALFQETITRR